ncbi:hypothetical protein DFH11DRAFT_450961 [Phellopilus nigrolimitatus]|nr:hypothetical protein DFH11DRAFT_450961 [Phellopilus nigrolimitatus]
MSDTAAAMEQELLIQGVHDSIATRYVTAVGLVFMLYDHLLTFQDEVNLVWTAKPSFAKKLFLLNRYVVPISQVMTASFMNHFGESLLSDDDCKMFLCVTFILGILSVGCANVLVILRVITLWERDRRVVKLMGIGFLFCFTPTLCLTIIVLSKAYVGFVYVEHVHMCVSTVKAPELPGVWACSVRLFLLISRAPTSPATLVACLLSNCSLFRKMVFEVLVLACVVFNAIGRPRLQDTPLRRVLYRDGLFFFVFLSTLRTINLIISIAARSTLILVSSYFVWSMTTLVLNHSLLDIQKVASLSSHSHSASRTRVLRRGRTHSGSHSLKLTTALSKTSVDSNSAAESGMASTPVSVHTGSRVRSRSPLYSGADVGPGSDRVNAFGIEHVLNEADDDNYFITEGAYSDESFAAGEQNLDVHEGAWGIELGNRRIHEP